MKILKFTLVAVFILQGCVTQFIPEVGDSKDYIAIDGLITDQNNAYKVEITRTSPLGSAFTRIPIEKCIVSITDNFENNYLLKEKSRGIYISDSLKFRGIVGRKYILHITADGHNFESVPMEMKPVPPIDKVSAEIVYNNTYQLGKIVPGYQIYIDAHDPQNGCRFYRWNFTETWEFQIPYIFETIVNWKCWKTAISDKIYIENTSVLSEDRVTRYPLNFITTETDRLTVKYSMLVRQFSLNENEYNYWSKLKRITEQIGGLYDVVPMSVESNIYCTDSPSEKVLGFFSASAVTSKRIFIESKLTGVPNFYAYCPTDTVPVGRPIPNLGISVFIIQQLNQTLTSPSVYVLTRYKECVDCTLRGTNKMPDFWNTTKNDIVIQSVLR
jgi:hypothetical protein